MPRPTRTPNVTLRQLRAFVAAAQDGGVTRAAERLHLTPSALSMLIRGLEAELAVRLFDRTGRRIELTAAGRALLPRAERAFVDLGDAFEEARRAGDGREGVLAVASSPLLAAEPLPRLLADFGALHPGIRVSLMDLGVDAIAEAVRRGRADLGICTAEAESAGLETLPLFQDRMMLACPADHALAKRRAVRWRELAAEPLVLMREGTGLRELVDRTFAELGEQVAPVQQVAHVGTAVGMVGAGLGLAILPAYALARARVAGVAVVPLAEPVVHRDIVALMPAGRSLSGAGAAFVEHLRRSLTGETAPAPARRTAARKKTA